MPSDIIFPVKRKVNTLVYWDNTIVCLDMVMEDMFQMMRNFSIRDNLEYSNVSILGQIWCRRFKRHAKEPLYKCIFKNIAPVCANMCVPRLMLVEVTMKVSQLFEMAIVNNKELISLSFLLFYTCIDGEKYSS